MWPLNLLSRVQPAVVYTYDSHKISETLDTKSFFFLFSRQDFPFLQFFFSTKQTLSRRKKNTDKHIRNYRFFFKNAIILVYICTNIGNCQPKVSFPSKIISVSLPFKRFFLFKKPEFMHLKYGKGSGSITFGSNFVDRLPPPFFLHISLNIFRV